jgi:hypothetical protein
MATREKNNEKYYNLFHESDKWKVGGSSQVPVCT